MPVPESDLAGAIIIDCLHHLQAKSLFLDNFELGLCLVVSGDTPMSDEVTLNLLVGPRRSIKACLESFARLFNAARSSKDFSKVLTLR